MTHAAPLLQEKFPFCQEMQSLESCGIQTIRGAANFSTLDGRFAGILELESCDFMRREC